MTRSIALVDRMRWMSALGAAAMLALTLTVALASQHGQLPSVAGGPATAAPAPAGSSAPLDPRIAALADRHPGQVVQTIVQFRASVSADRARWDVARVSGQVFGELHIINALAVKLTAAAARSLAANPDVHAVSLNAEVKPMGGPGGWGGPGGRGAGPGGWGGPGGRGAGPGGWGGQRGHDGGPGGWGRHDGGTGSGPSPTSGVGGGPSTGSLETTYDQTMDVTGLWRDGFDGAGIGVAVVDTGIDGSLPDFQSSNGTGSRVVETAVTNPDAKTITDSYGHGTDVAGIIAGNGGSLPSSDPLKGDYIGVAPDANLISIKVSDESGHATVLDVIYGLQFAVDHQSDYHIRVVNLSLDSTTPQSYTTDPLDAAVESAWMHGIVVVVAAGNRGSTPNAVQFSPANDPYAITVGAVDENGSSNPLDDTIAPWSSQGTTQDGFQKPDVYAPGAHIVSVLAPNSVFASMSPSSIIGGEYIVTSGTSMATPMISGLVADILQAHPDWTPDQVKGALTDPSAASNPSIQELDAAKVVALSAPAPADQGLTPNQLIDPSTGDIDYSQSSWSQSSWSQATGPLAASFAQSSWSCSCIQAAGAGSVGPSTSSWSTGSWSTSSWSTYFDSSSSGS